MWFPLISNDCQSKTSKQHLTDRVHLARSQIGKTSAKARAWFETCLNMSKLLKLKTLPFKAGGCASPGGLFWMDFPRQGNRVYTSAIMPFASRNQLVETLLEFHGESHWKLVWGTPAHRRPLQNYQQARTDNAFAKLKSTSKHNKAMTCDKNQKLMFGPVIESAEFQDHHWRQFGGNHVANEPQGSQSSLLIRSFLHWRDQTPTVLLVVLVM